MGKQINQNHKKHKQMPISCTIIFDHRNRTKPDQEGPVELRFIHNRKAYYINTGISAKKNELISGTIINRSDAEELNSRLLILTKRANQEINACIDRGHVIDVQSIKRKLYGTAKVSSTTLLDWMTEQIPTLHLCEGTSKHYYTVINRMRTYGEITAWEDITVEALYRFDNWLHTIRRPPTASNPTPQYISDATIYTYHKCLKALLNRAEKFGLIPRNPYSRLKGEFKRGDKVSVEYLTEEEMSAFMSLRPTPNTQMALARDLFVFQMFTGLAYSDAQRFDINDYKREGDKWIHVGQRIKTGVPYVSQLLPPVIEVLERYEWRVPKLDNSDYNRCLKALGMAAGITTPMHSHLARHTFATYMLRNGVKIENVSKMLGHTNITQTQRYAKVIAQSVRDDFDMITEKIKGMP